MGVNDVPHEVKQAMERSFDLVGGRHDALLAMVKAYRDLYAANQVAKRVHDARDNSDDPDEAIELRADEAEENAMEMQHIFEAAVDVFVRTAKSYRAQFPAKATSFPGIEGERI
jgi:hypothetical protein